MTTRVDQLFMVRLQLETKGLFDLARRRRLPMRMLDTGYLVHCHLKELFGENAPMPFAVAGEAGRLLTVLGYTTCEAESLQNHAQTYSDPSVYRNCIWPHLASKPLPTDWPEGKRLGFDVRACPVERKASDGAFHRKGAEVDVFVSRCWKIGDRQIPVSREEIYCDWLSDQIRRIGGARLVKVSVRAFKLERLLRRDHAPERKSCNVEKPGALFSGILDITGASQFNQLLRRGAGRHRTFGFGMILLKNIG